MPKTTGKTISLIEILPPQTSYEDEDEENFLDIPTRAIATRISEIPVEVLSKGLFKFVDALGDILKDLPNECGTYKIDELTFDLSVTGTGEVSSRRWSKSGFRVLE